MEREGQWIESAEHNFLLDPTLLEYGVVEPTRVPEPEVTDRANIAAQLNAFGSAAVQTQYDSWRTAADDAVDEIEMINSNWSENYIYPERPEDDRDVGTLGTRLGPPR